MIAGRARMDPVCSLIVSLLIILLHRLLWRYSQTGGVIQNGALCHASMGSRGLDTKATFSVSDITAISSAMLLPFCVQPSPLARLVCNLLLRTRCMHEAKPALCFKHAFNIWLFLSWQLTGDRERRPRWLLRVREKKHSLRSLHKLWWIQISPFVDPGESMED